MKILVTGGAGFIGGNFVYFELDHHPEDTVVCLDALTYAGNMETLRSALKNPKFSFVQGNIADRDAVYALIEQERPDLILLDINIPGVDGLEIARRLKANAALSTIPIIATTANVLIGDRERCLEAGCDAYLPKPLDVRELQDVLRAYLGRANGHH